MAKSVILLSVVVVLAALVMESNCEVRYFDKIIQPTYRPPPQRTKPVIRYARDTSDQEPLWYLYQGNDVIRAPTSQDLFSFIFGDVRPGPRRHARSLGTTGGGRIGSNDRGNRGSRGHDTGATHPGWNRRNTRSVHLPDFVTTPPFNPKPWPQLPREKPRIPIYV